jgi:NADPH2:quinone reductase
MSSTAAIGTFRAYQVSKERDETTAGVVSVTEQALSPGAVLIRAAYSCINFKDARIASGTFRQPLQFPLIPGIDVSGVVVSSEDPRFRPGDRVLVTGYELGVTHSGGFAEYVRVPGDWIVRVPEQLDLFEVMAIGTAGFTAALAIMDLERNGLRPGSGRVVVTGATGGVGSIAIDCLTRLGYEVTAVTGKADRHEYLRELGASEVVSRDTITSAKAPLARGTWAGAVDAVGGEMLAALTRSMAYRGAIASCGLTGGDTLQITVFPFILRGARLLGIDSVMCPAAPRQEAWTRLATDVKPRHLGRIAHEIALEEIGDVVNALLAGSYTGRAVVRLAPEGLK